MVSFEGVESLGVASKLVGKSVLAKKADLPSDFALRDVEALMGREVVDERHGTIGRVCEVMRGPAGDVWVVRGPYGEVLVPAVEPIVRSWEPEEPLCVDLPRGLVSQDAALSDDEGSARDQ